MNEVERKGRAVVPEGRYEGRVVEVCSRTVRAEAGVRQRLVVDVEIEVGEELGGRAVVPMWVSPVVMPPDHRSRGSKLYELLWGFRLLADVEDRFPGACEWSEEREARELGEWLDEGLRGRRVVVWTRKAQSMNGDGYSVVSRMVTADPVVPERTP